MSYEITWRLRALDASTRFLKDDPEGLRQVFIAVDLLSGDPRPSGTAEYGSPDLRRMHVGQYRVMYEIADETITSVVVHLGRVG
ncbi:type II toxin-antitoxin system RelE/ParE family toxin [Streptomyces sp. A3M-1-3]|uniref:type II toxin-antitoxin system RelE family toxin n=1 Tax=Streptomyces sp. A3M-1-3 TaxID=2962044 RepID=UPI0020B8CB51|nr:type II toxin-antitoxin system RelE/ParE family toxin [Streptomyces sp. A3M-1-3]MCP3822616.1 type II toxin-antitoxin system RelE/ParE family toxin [Streptomyces sp. A3M-1-3]